MVAYQHFTALCNSSDADRRGEAAHMVATAYIDHDGPADEQAALYASILGFLDDPSVKVRASLAFGLLHSNLAPRIVMLSLLKDASVIACAVLQYSPVLLDVDLIGVAQKGQQSVLVALANRELLSERLVRAIVERGEAKSLVLLLGRVDLDIASDLLKKLVASHGSDAKIRGTLLARSDLPAICRLELVAQVKQALSGARIVKGAIAPARLERLMRDAVDHVTTRMGEEQAIAGNSEYVEACHEKELINTRILLHSVVNGHVLFFADCIALLADMPPRKVFTLLEAGARVGLNALFTQCGMNAPLRNLLSRLVLHARTADLSNDEAARHFVVTALIEELIIEHEGDIPQSLEEAFLYLDEQNLLLARAAARGVMPAFAQNIEPEQQLLPEAYEPVHGRFHESVPGQVPGQLEFDVHEDSDAHILPQERLALPAA